MNSLYLIMRSGTHLGLLFTMTDLILLGLGIVLYILSRIVRRSRRTFSADIMKYSSLILIVIALVNAFYFKKVIFL